MLSQGNSQIMLQLILQDWYKYPPVMLLKICIFLKPLTLDIAPQSLPALPQYPALENSYHFSPPAPTSSSHSRDFYRVNRCGVFLLTILYLKFFFRWMGECVFNKWDAYTVRRIWFDFCRLMMSSRRISLVRLCVVSFASHLQGLLLRSVWTATLQVCSHQIKINK